MYYQSFGLQKEPFGMTPDPSFLFLSAAHREALAGLTYAILNRKGFAVLTGDAGTGKTTLLTRVVKSVPESRARFSVVLNPTLTPSEFLELVLLDFGIPDVPASKAQRLNILQEFLGQAFKQRQVPVLVVDEAHKLPPDVLEEIRLLSNFELPEGKLLQIVLAGQTELGGLLNRQDLRQLKQRIAVRLAIHPLSASDVAHYIQHRWQRAGASQPHPFQPQAIHAIVQYSHGIPRLVNVLCDNALMLAYGEGISVIGESQIVEAARDLDLLGQIGRVAGAGGGAAATYRIAANGGTTQAAANGPVTVPMPIRVPALERYASPSTEPSRLMRLAGKLGLGSKAARERENL
jgi:general secretion pathway protein A